MDGVDVAIVSAEELAKGWNMGLLERGPVAEQCRGILAQVSDKDRLVSQWRKQSAEAATLRGDNSLRDSMEKLNVRILAVDAKIRQAAQPKPHHFDVAPSR